MSLYNGNFNLSVSPAEQAVASGGKAIFTLTVSPVPMPGYPPLPQGEVDLAGTGARGLTVSVSPAAVELGATPVTATGTVVANLPTQQGKYPVVFAAMGAREVRVVTVYVDVN